VAALYGTRAEKPASNAGIAFAAFASLRQRDAANDWARGGPHLREFVYLVKPVSFEGLLPTVKALDLYWLELSRCPRVAGV
jgi:hypothetical protein